MYIITCMYIYLNIFIQFSLQIEFPPRSVEKSKIGLTFFYIYRIYYHYTKEAVHLTLAFNFSFKVKEKKLMNKTHLL